MSAILAANRGERDYPWQGGSDHQAIPSVSPAEAPAWLASHDAAVLDVREPAEYDAGHLPNAVSIPQADVGLRLDEIPKNRDLLVVCQGGNRSLRVAQFLSRVGYEHVHNLEGGTSGWTQAGNPIVR